MKEKLSLKVKLIIGLIIILILVLVFVVRPFFEFKKIESKFLDSGKRYYEINTTKLPTGKRINKLYLKELYDKDYLDSDYKENIINNNCNIEESFIRVSKKQNEYKYEAYLECGLWKSKIDHEGPVIKLKGKDEINLYMNEEYKELGVSSVVDDTDGSIDIKNVEIDSSKVKSSKVGTYEVIYKVKDSYNNVTTKVRTVKVIETLNHVISSQTNKKNVYQGQQFNNYLMLDGIIFRLVGINSDKTVKIVTDESISAVNYNDVNDWLNKYFYEKFSDSAKDYIVKKSTWCIDNVSDTTTYTKCSKYSKKNPVGLLSVIDINNSKNSDGVSMLNGNTLINNLKNNKTSYLYSKNSFIEKSINDNVVLTPTLNIIKDAPIVSGDGSEGNPFKLKGNTSYLKPGDKISAAKAGEYITYSGYTWRVIGKEDDETTKIIMNEIVKNNTENYNIIFSSSKSINFNTSKKENIGYELVNNVGNYVNTSLFASKNIDYPKYTKNIGYKESNKANQYKLKVNLPSMYDLFSTTIKEEYWFKEYSHDNYCYMYYEGTAECSEYTGSSVKGIRVVAYLKKGVTVVLGKGDSATPYSVNIK